MITCPFCGKTHNWFYLVDVKSTININGKDIAFDYINTYLDFDSAMLEARTLTENNDILSVSVHKRILSDGGTQEHAEDKYNIPYSYINKTHRDFKEE